MKKIKRTVGMFLALIMLFTVISPMAANAHSWQWLRNTPVSGAGVSREAFCTVRNSTNFTIVIRAQLILMDGNGITIAQTPRGNAVNIAPGATGTAFSARLTSSARTQTFADFGGRV